MSSSHDKPSWLEAWWPLFVILYGVIFVSFIVFFHPTI
jgi:hypothetical protein